MSQYWKRLSVALAAGLALAFCAPNAIVFADDPEPEAKAEAPEGSEDDIVLDENLPENKPEEENVEATLEQAVESDLESVKESSGEDLLNLATDLKLSASTLLDLTKVISLCNKAEKRGLDDASLEFAKQLRLSARLDRGLAVAQLFLNPDLPLDQLPNGWEALRNNAIGDLSTALEETPDLPIAQLSIGRLYMLADRADEAKKALDVAIASEDAENEEKVLALMFRAMTESDPNAALPFVERAIEIEPTAEPRLYSQYSAYLELADRTDDAMKQIDKALELAPDQATYKKEKAILLAKQKRNDEARALYEEATKGEDSNLAQQIEKGQFLASIDDFNGALALYSKLLEKFDGPGLYFLRGTIYAQMKDYPKAIADANQALRRDDNLLPALRLKGVVYLQMEKYDDAIRTFEILKKKAGSDADKLEATTQIAYAISKQGKYKKATALLKTELDKNPENADVLRAQADMELLFGHWDKAGELYKKLLEINPKDSGVLNNYSWLLSTCPDDQFRDAAKAMEYGQAAAEETKYLMPHILSTLAAAYAENGDFENARKWSQKAVELGEKENHEALDSLRKELESYKENKPWRETSEILQEVEDDAEPEAAASEEQPQS